MLATRWEPLFGLNRLDREVNSLFDELTKRTPRVASRVYPTLNLYEDDENLYIEAELPGLQLEDLEVHVLEGNQVSIQGERKQPELEEARWLRQERGYGRFLRKVELPEQVDRENVKATLSGGVLTVSLAKSEASKPRKIAVQTD